MPTPQSTARKMLAASAPSRDPYRAGAADRHIPRPVHSSRQNNGSVSHPTSTYPTASPKLDKREASAGTSTLLPQTPSRRSSVQHGSKSKEDIKRGKTSKPGFFASFFHKLISCIGLSTRAHDIDTDSVPSVVSHSSLRERETRELSEKVPGSAGIPISRAAGPAAPLPERGRPVAPPKDVPPIPNNPTSGAVQPPGSSFPNQSEDGADSGDDTHVPLESLFDDEDMILLRNGGAGIPIGSDGTPRPLLPPIKPRHTGKKCLVLDLDETLVHSNFRAIPDPDFIVPVEIDNHWHNMYVQKRPGVDDFLRQMGEMYEIVVYTASLSAYADPVMDHLDMYNVVSHRLFRESCYRFKGNFVKDLSQLGRRMEDTIIIDNSPASYIFHPANAVPISSWFNDPHDTELMDLCPFLSDLAETRDVRAPLNPGL